MRMTVAMKQYNLCVWRAEGAEGRVRRVVAVLCCAVEKGGDG